MYTSFFSLKENPFNLTPDPRYLFLSQTHKEALDHLLYGINEKKGFIAVTGGIGTGKTTLCRALLSRLDPDSKSALIFNSFISDAELLKAVNQEFGMEMEPDAESKKDYVDALNRFLLNNFSKGNNAVLMIDEAQNLSHSVLEQIRMLSNLETEKEKLVQIILMGQPELKELLHAPSLKQLNERITVRYDLKPLDATDIKNYVQHRLVTAGSRGNLKFTKGAFKQIFNYSRGIPRRINAVCDRALLIAYTVEKQTITKRMMKKAVHEIRGDLRSHVRPTLLTGRRLGFPALTALFLMVVAAMGGWALKKGQWEPVLNQQTAESDPDPFPHRPVQPGHDDADLFLDDRSSLSGLFRLFSESHPTGALVSGKIQMGLMTLTVNPQCLDRVKKPFRILYSETDTASFSSDRYVLVSRFTEKGVVFIDQNEKEHLVDEDLLIKCRNPEISWFYPYQSHDDNLTKGMTSPDVETVRSILYEAGYLVERFGLFDEQMSRAVMAFQKDFGLMPDGIVGPQTMAVLYLLRG